MRVEHLKIAAGSARITAGYVVHAGILRQRIRRYDCIRR